MLERNVGKIYEETVTNQHEEFFHYIELLLSILPTIYDENISGYMTRSLGSMFRDFRRVLVEVSTQFLMKFFSETINLEAF